MKKIITCLIVIILSFIIKFGFSQKVAIIGEGLGSALSSYFLHKIIPGVKIDIYNHQPSKDTLFSEISFNSHNVYINDIIKEKDVQTVRNDGTYIIKDGDKFYNSDLKKSARYETFHEALEEFIMKQLQIFKQIYNIQKNGQTFKTVRELLKSLSTEFENYYVNETTENLLINKNPLIAAHPDIQKYIKNGIACNFTNTNIHGFAGLSLLMFSEIIEELQQVVPQDTDLFIQSLFHMDDKTIEKDVSIIVHENNKNYVVSIDGRPTLYDFIILGTTTAAEIKFVGFSDPVEIFKYRDSHILNVTGRLSKKFNKILKDLIPVCDIHNNRVYMQIPFPNTTVFSIAALQQPSKYDISQFVKPHKIKHNFSVHAPPDYSAQENNSLRNAKFELTENLYNVHALHSLSIFHEMLAIGAKNIALLIRNRIEEIGTFSDERNLSEERSGAVEQIINRILYDQNKNGETASSSTVGRRTNKSRSESSVVGQLTTLNIDERITSGSRASSSTIRQRTRGSESRKSRESRANRNKSKANDSKKKF